ncbi:putative nuclease HARBI1 [Ostrea edulis]|uniref:putative nuclease HARBI1 n=1 Tax=Ostrea edulis TaxID=37623 RepID=UPI0024AF803F|nr:putative nuclease HARBI1 [Ostrea edulis]
MAINNRSQRRRRRHRQRIAYNRLVDRENPLENLCEVEVFKRYRFRPDTVLYITGLLAPSLTHETLRSCALPPLLQVLVTLRFLATGGFYSLISDTFSSISPPSICRAVRDVCRGLCWVARQFINMPTGPRMVQVKQEFFAIAGFPNVLGCVDGTFIKLQAPSQNEPDYVNRKGYHSLNVQVFCAFNISIFMDHIRFHNTTQYGQYKGFLLGDSGYPCKPYLMTPYPVPSTPAEVKFNNCHAKTRVLIEQTFGILKKRFSCLSTGLRTTPDKACSITLACAVLHNIGIERNDILDVDELFVNQEDVSFDVGDQRDGKHVRDYICQAFFS